MAEFKHTPGPWKVFPEESSTMVYCDDCLGSRVADCSAQHTILQPEERKANAKLIAAAPDMFEVIKQLYDWAQANQIFGPIYPKLEAAYKKATT